MKTITISENLTVELPDNYVPPPLLGRDEWCAALRSGEYEQGEDYLCNGGKYCCLGVLSKIQGRLVDGADNGSDFELSADNPLNPVLGGVGALPKGAAAVIVGEFPENNLASINDSEATFLEIASVIEAVWSDGGALEKEPEARVDAAR